MKFRRSRDTPSQRELYPPSFTQAWIRRTLPTASPAEARGLLETMRGRGWTEAEVAERILPHMPRAREGRAIAVPAKISTEWLDRRLAGMDREDIGQVVDELERRGWPATEVAVAVLPHLLPKLPPADAATVLAGLRELGMSAEQIARLAPAG